MNRLEMRNLMLNIIDERLDNTGLETHFNEEECNEYLEQAYEIGISLIFSRDPFRFFRRTNGSTYPHISVSSGVDFVSLPEDFTGPLVSVELMSGETAVRGALNHKHYVDGVKADNTLTGKPEYFDVLGQDQLWLYPKPNADYVLRIAYNYRPTFPVDDTTEITFPVGHLMFVVYQALKFSIPKWGAGENITNQVVSDYMIFRTGLIDYLNKPRQIYQSRYVFKGDS